MVKYPRTLHLPWSEGITNDDKVLKSISVFEGTNVVVTEKMDGENTSLYHDSIHARSLDSRNHPSRNWVKNFWATIKHGIPSGWRVCGENLYAKHTIFYEELESYFLGFSLWDENNNCLSWRETLGFFEELGIEPVKVLYEGIFDETKIKSLWDSLKKNNSEGYVVRSAEWFHYSLFDVKVAKFVRKDHVQTDKHWMQSMLIENKLKV